jgi:hypothetical protein
MNKKAILEAKKELRLINSAINQAKKGKLLKLLRFYTDVFACDLYIVINFYTLVATCQTKKAKKALSALYANHQHIIEQINKNVLVSFEGMAEVET